MEKLTQEEIAALIAALEGEGDETTATTDSTKSASESRVVEDASKTPKPRVDEPSVSKPSPELAFMPYVGPHNRRPVRTYDFRSPDKFSKEQIRTLLLLHENFTRNASTELSAYIRSVVQLEAVHIGQTSYVKWMQQLSDPTVLAIVELAPLQGRALLELTTDIAFPILDRLLGGRGSVTNVQRSLTEIETRVVKRILNILLNAWVDAWRPIAELEAHIESTEGSPLFVQLMPPGEIIISLLVDVIMDKMQGTLRLCMPYTLLEPVLPKLSAHSWFAREGKTTEDYIQERWIQHLSGVDVNMHVELPATQITVRQLMDLSVGDVILLPGSPRDDLVMAVNGIPRFRVTPGTLGKKMAVRIRSFEGDDG